MLRQQQWSGVCSCSAVVFFFKSSFISRAARVLIWSLASFELLKKWPKCSWSAVIFWWLIHVQRTGGISNRYILSLGTNSMNGGLKSVCLSDKYCSQLFLHARQRCRYRIYDVWYLPITIPISSSRASLPIYRWNDQLKSTCANSAQYCWYSTKVIT